MDFNFDKSTKILIVGLGLIGGGYAQALTAKGYEVGALDAKQESIDFALEHCFIKHGKSAIDRDYIAEFDIIVFALYPHIFLDWIRENQDCIRHGALLTDVTGVKIGVVREIQNMLREDLEFIGAHPMAGREMSGVENSTKDVFEDANYIVTPTEKNSNRAINACMKLGREIGFGTISILSPEEHDEMIGFLSQLTHCIAVSLMVCKDSRHLVDYTGDSFRDLTRIAKINDDMWSELFLLNKDELLRQMDLFKDKFLELRDCIANDDREKMRDMMRLSTEHRKYFDKKEV